METSRTRASLSASRTDGTMMAMAAATKAGVGASGLPDQQYHVLRERVAAFVRKAPYAFTTAELQVLRAREAQLKEYEALLTAEVR